MKKNWKEVELGDISTMKFGEIPKKGKNLLYTEPELQVVAKGIEDMGRVKLSRPKSPIINTSIVIKLNEDIADKRYCYYYYRHEI